MKRSVLFCVIALLLSACGNSGKELVFKKVDGMSAGDQKAAANGIATLITACPGIGRYWGDLKQIEAVAIRAASLTDQRERGWKEVVSVALKVSDRPESIPFKYHASGHICRFDVWTEVSIAKSPCISVCTDSESKVSNAYIQAK